MNNTIAPQGASMDRPIGSKKAKLVKLIKDQHNSVSTQNSTQEILLRLDRAERDRKRQMLMQEALLNIRLGNNREGQELMDKVKQQRLEEEKENEKETDDGESTSSIDNEQTEKGNTNNNVEKEKEHDDDDKTDSDYESVLEHNGPLPPLPEVVLRQNDDNIDNINSQLSFNQL